MTAKWSFQLVTTLFVFFTCFLQGKCIVLRGASAPSVTWSCPIGWTPFTGDEKITCLFMPIDMADSASNANEKCQTNQNANILLIDSESKFKVYKDFTQIYQHQGFWTGFKKSSYSGFNYLTPHGYSLASFVPSVFQTYRRNMQIGDSLFFQYPNDVSRQRAHYGSSDKRYICEKEPDCAEGYFGPGCSQVCHCNGKVCHQKNQEFSCRHGCEIGWMGSKCDKPKEDATIKYTCIKSPDQGDYVHIRVYTKGVNYDKIQAIDSAGRFMPWCNNTEVYVNEAANVHTIKIFTDDNVTSEMKRGPCPGKMVNSSTFSLTIKIQEKEGFVSMNDQLVEVSCGDFSDYDTRTVSGKTAVTTKDEGQEPNTLDSKREFLSLSVVDSFSGASVVSAAVGSPVALKISFGHGANQEATGVEPYSCYASSPEGDQKIQVLDAQGCPMPGSILSAFYNNGSKTMLTEAFSLPRLPGGHNIEFHCFYHLCYDQEPCQGCTPTAANDTMLVRHRRSTEPIEYILKNSVHVTKPY